MTELEIVRGAAMLLAQKMCIDTNATQASITVGGMQKKDGSDKPRNFRVVVTQISDEEVEHNRNSEVEED